MRWIPCFLGLSRLPLNHIQDSFVEGEDGSRIPSPRISIVDESIFGSSTSISPSSPTPVVGTAHSVTCASTVMEELMGGSSPCNTSASSAASIGEGDGDTDGEEAGSAVVSPAIEGRPNNPINIAAGNRSVEGGDEINNEDDTHEGGSTEDTMTRLQLQKKVSFDARLRNLPHQEEAADGDEDSGMEEVPETEVLSPRLRSTSADDDPAPPESAQKDGSHSLSASTAKLVPGYQRPLKRFSTLEERLEARRSRTSVPPHSTTQSAPQSPRNRGVESQPMHQHHQSAEPPLRRQSSSPSLRAHNRSPSAGSMTGALERRDSVNDRPLLLCRVLWKQPPCRETTLMLTMSCMFSFFGGKSMPPADGHHLADSRWIRDPCVGPQSVQGPSRDRR